MAGQAAEDEPAAGGRLPAAVGRDRGQAPRPGDRPGAHRAPLFSRAAHKGAPGLLSQFLSHSPPSAAVHQRPPRPSSGRSRTVADAGQHCWKACWLQALASSNLASSATLTCRSAGPGRRQAGTPESACLIFWLSFEPQAVVRRSGQVCQAGPGAPAKDVPARYGVPIPQRRPAVRRSIARTTATMSRLACPRADVSS
jgi:hypothetical protein